MKYFVQKLLLTFFSGYKEKTFLPIWIWGKNKFLIAFFYDHDGFFSRWAEKKNYVQMLKDFDKQKKLLSDIFWS